MQDTSCEPQPSEELQKKIVRLRGQLAESHIHEREQNDRLHELEQRQRELERKLEEWNSRWYRLWVPLGELLRTDDDDEQINKACKRKELKQKILQDRKY